jgi:hypothetical protein
MLEENIEQRSGENLVWLHGDTFAIRAKAEKNP